MISLPLPRPLYPGSVLDHTFGTWYRANEIRLRERYRELQDGALKLGLEFPPEQDFVEFCEAQWDVECQKQRYERERP